MKWIDQVQMTASCLSLLLELNSEVRKNAEW